MNNTMINELCNQLKLLEGCASNQQPIPFNVVLNIREGIASIVQQTSDKNPAINQHLTDLKNNLFIPSSHQYFYFNLIVYGQMIEFLEFIKGQVFTTNQADNGKLCGLLHPDILKISGTLYRDGHYAEAACNAFIEINSRLKKMYSEANPNAENIPDGQTLMNKAFADNNPLFYVGDTTNQTGKDIQSGTRFLFAGAMAAFRNPKSHENFSIAKEDSMRRLIFASMLMFTIDEIVQNSKLQTHK